MYMDAIGIRNLEAYVLDRSNKNHTDVDLVNHERSSPGAREQFLPRVGPILKK